MFMADFFSHESLAYRLYKPLIGVTPGAHKGKERSTLNYVVIIFNTYLRSTAIQGRFMHNL